MRDELKRFHSPEMRAWRARLARTLLASRRDFAKIEEGGGVTFDDRMRPGVVRRSNALAMMRSVGLEV
jgi:hypothetical protein